jgi:poly-gamma-glutamate synthesis protein (capsule biosynthesis protein)
VQEFAAENPNRFRWSEYEGDLQLVLQDGMPLASWHYAVVAPFPTIVDSIELDALIDTWRQGSLHTDPETAALLIALWGKPASQSTLFDVDTETLVELLWNAREGYDQPPLAIVPFDRLDPRLKVLRIGNTSPIDVDYDSSQYPLAVSIGLVGNAEHVDEFIASWGEHESNRDDNHITQLAMTGPAGMRRAVADRMEKHGLTYPAEETGPILQAVDIAHMSNENAFAPDCPMPDPYDSTNVCNRDEYIELMTWMGIDVNEMTGNHLNDWGVQSLLHTFNLYEATGIETFGGGRNLSDARQPLLLEHNGNRIALVGCNPVGPPTGWAREDYPGSLPCDDYGDLKGQISRLDEQGYLVIATLQYLEGYQYEVTAKQRRDFSALASAGATVISGSHGHHPQGFAFQDEAFIHYGLGNLLADQMFMLGTRQMFIDTYLIYDGRLLNVDFWTGFIEDFARPRVMTNGERRELLQSVFDASDW